MARCRLNPPIWVGTLFRRRPQLTCNNCHAEIREGSRFCPECGARQAATCPSCGHPTGSADKFCAECGSSLAGAGTPAGQAAARVSGTPTAVDSAPTIEERRFITAVFADLVGFTPLTQARDAEDVRRMLTIYFERAKQIVDRFGGTIDKFIGDALMAVWGAHLAHEDDAERAVRAALELVSAVQDLGRELDLPDLRARAGVLSGEAATGGDLNEGTGLIIGDIVNTASRLQGAADPGTVLVGRSTRDLAERSIEFTPSGEHQLKGLDGPVEAFRAVRVVAGSRGNRRADGLEPPFVGRADEMRMLKDALHATTRDGRSRLVSIIGEGGIGKSRLMEEMWKYVDGLPETTYWHQGRSPAYGDGVAFWSLGEMVRQRCGIAEGDDGHRARTRLRTTLAEFIEDAADREWVEPRLEGLLGLAPMPVGDQTELFAAWRLLFVEIARRDSVVMVFEDLHWADDGLLDFIEELVTVAADQPILVVTLARPELLERRPGWGSGRTSTLSTHLAPLADPTMRELLEGVVVDPPRLLVDQLVERAGGMPLYAVELLRMLHSQGQLVEVGDGRFRYEGDPHSVEIPDSLHGLVGARLDQLDPVERTLVQDAAILGQSFTLEGLGALRGGNADELREALAALVRREVLSVNRDPRSPERGQYRFVQSIIREVAHQRIPKAERFARHLDVAHYFRSLGEPEVVGIVASHLLDSLEVAPAARRDEIRAEAVASLLAAADRADSLQAPQQVLRLCERGIGLTDDLRHRGELLTRAARAAHAVVDPRAEEFARRAMEAFQTAADRAGTVRAATTWGQMLNNEGRSNEAWRILTDALGEEPGESEDEARAMAELARAYMLDLRDDEGLVWLERVLPIAERLELVPVVVDAMITKGSAFARRGRIVEGMALLKAALDMARQRQLLHAKQRVLNNISYGRAADVPRYGRAEMVERIEDARRAGHSRAVADLLAELAWDHALEFEFEEATGVLADIDVSSVSDRARFRHAQTFALIECLTSDPGALKRLAGSEEDRQGDAQATATAGADRVLAEYLAGEFEVSHDEAMALPEVPLRLDLMFGLFTALRLHDAAKLRRVADLAAASPVRGRSITLMRRAAEGALASLEGRREEAVDAWSGAIELAEQVWPGFQRNLLKAEAGAFLGTDEDPGRTWGREAYEVYRDVGAVAMFDFYSDGLVTDDDVSAQPDVAAG
jgi:class 3 adenylate cyclase/tetratricopeptide (TPR) repeat protein